MSDELPDAQQEAVWPDQSAVHGVLLEQVKDAYAEGITDTVAKLRARAAEVLPEVARFTLDEIETICADRAVEQRVVYRVRDRSSDYKAMCHEDRDHAELLLKAWLSDGRDAVIERRHVFDGGWSPVERPFFTEQQERALARCEGYDEGYAASPDERLREVDRRVILEWAKFTRDEAAGYWGRREEDVYQRLLAAADREAPEDR